MLKRLMVNIITSFLSKFVISKIQYVPLREFADQNMEGVKSLAMIPLDADANDKEQLRKLYFKENDRLVSSSNVLVQELIEDKIKDQELKLHLNELRDELFSGLYNAVKGPDK